jgi:hypothetical protein
MPTSRPSTPFEEAGRITQVSGIEWNPLVEHMIRRGIPVTRENYLDLNFPEGIPEHYGAEHEASLPSYLQDFDAPELKEPRNHTTGPSSAALPRRHRRRPADRLPPKGDLCHEAPTMRLPA